MMPCHAAANCSRWDSQVASSGTGRYTVDGHPAPAQPPPAGAAGATAAAAAAAAAASPRAAEGGAAAVDAAAAAATAAAAAELTPAPPSHSAAAITAGAASSSKQCQPAPGSLPQVARGTKWVMGPPPGGQVVGPGQADRTSAYSSQRNACRRPHCRQEEETGNSADCRQRGSTAGRNKERMSWQPSAQSFCCEHMITLIINHGAD
jgi:hypothetical protein